MGKYREVVGVFFVRFRALFWIFISSSVGGV
jgi:hypothetical protein